MIDARFRTRDAALLFAVATFAVMATINGTLRCLRPISLLDVSSCARICGGQACYENGTSICPGSPNGCDDTANCAGFVNNNGVLVVYCESDDDGQNFPTAYAQINVEYSDASGGNATGYMDDETWEPIYCYDIDTCSSTCTLNNNVWLCSTVGTEDGPLYWPTTAIGQACKNGQPVGGEAIDV
jgi:hypothetical protein